MSTIVLTGGTVLDQQGRRSGDVLIDAELGTILEVGPGLSGDVELDASGCVITPGFVDLHVHLREPGDEAAETIESGSRSAALGGYTAVIAMPTTDPCPDAAPVVDEILALGRTALCEIRPAAAITLGRQGRELAPMEELAARGVRMFTDSGTGLQDDRLMRRALEYAGSLSTADGVPIVLAQHCEVAELSAGGMMHEGEWSSRLGLGGQPAEAEELMVMRDIALARLTGTRIHFQHLSTAGSVAMVRAAKAGGLPVTAEATPHHVALTDAACAGFDPVFKVDPPLRSAADVEAVREGMRDGTIDAVATDHAPHPIEAKERPFDQAPPGMLGLETALAVVMAEVGLSLDEALPLFSWRPAEIAGLADRHGRPVAPGEPANLAVIDPDATWVVSGAESASRSQNTPFEGRTLTGRVRHTIHAGEAVVIDFEATR